MKHYQTNSKILRPLLALLLAISLLAVSACAGDRETRVARWPLSVFPAAEKKGKSIATLSKGERVDLIEPGESFSKIRMAGGKEGFVESQHLFVNAAVLIDRDSRLYVRPSASSGISRHDKKLQPGVVFFVGERVQNEEGAWLSVQGGSRDTYFSGWLAADAAYNEELAMVQEGFALEKAIRAKDLATLDELSGKSAPIGPAAAVALEDLGGLPPEDESDAESKQETEAESEDAAADNAESGANAATETSTDAKPDAATNSSTDSPAAESDQPSP